MPKFYIPDLQISGLMLMVVHLKRNPKCRLLNVLGRKKIFLFLKSFYSDKRTMVKESAFSSRPHVLFLLIMAFNKFLESTPGKETEANTEILTSTLSYPCMYKLVFKDGPIGSFLYKDMYISLYILHVFLT